MATIYDVAAMAGVSPKTVSRRINGDGPVSAKTRASIDAAIRSLGYIPSNAARMMRSTKSRLVGLITGAISHQSGINAPTGLPDFHIIQEVQGVMDAAGMTLMIADTGGRADRIEPLIRTFLQHRVQGLLYVAEYHQQVALPAVHGDIPLVLVNCFGEGAARAILPDDWQGQYDLTARLIEAGHRRIAYAALKPDMTASRLRMAGYRDALAAGDVGFDPDLVVHAEPDRDRISTERLLGFLKRVLGLKDPATVICLGNDEMAMRAYGILRSMGHALPGDVSVAGFDNYRTIAEALYPPLTTVELPYSEMGRAGARHLLQLIETPETVPAAPVRIAGPVHWRRSVETRRNALEFASPEGGTRT